MTQLFTFLLLVAVLTIVTVRAQTLNATVSFNTPVASGFQSRPEALSLGADKKPARVVFNARTGTVVMGREMRVGAAAVWHGHLNVIIRESEQMDPSGMLRGRKTAVTATSEIRIHRGAGQVTTFSTGTCLRSIVDTLNSLGASPEDTLGILQALKDAGALDAELVVI